MHDMSISMNVATIIIYLFLQALCYTIIQKKILDFFLILFIFFPKIFPFMLHNYLYILHFFVVSSRYDVTFLYTSQ